MAAYFNDLSARPFLQLSIKNAVYNYSPTPGWFTLQLLQTNLPIISINTQGQTIVDDPRIICDMGIIYNGPGQQNCILDPFNIIMEKSPSNSEGPLHKISPKSPWIFNNRCIG